MPLILPNTIENDTPADASELQQNFSAVQTHVNANLLARDGSVAMTGPLLLSGDPTQDNHAANKEYVDAGPQTVTTWTPTVSGLTVGNGTTTAYYLKQGRQCTISYYFRFGSTSAMPGSGDEVTMPLPFEALNWGASGTGYLYDISGPEAWPIIVTLSSKTVIALSYFSTPAVGGVCGFMTVASASGWGVNDEVTFEMTYLTAA